MTAITLLIVAGVGLWTFSRGLKPVGTLYDTWPKKEPHTWPMKKRKH